VSKQPHTKLIVIVNEEGHSVTYVVRETDTAIAIEASIDSRTSAAAAARELVSLATAIMPNGIEKFYLFKVLRMVEEGIDELRDRMEVDADNSLDELPF